jgi:alpha-galactosidase
MYLSRCFVSIILILVATTSPSWAILPTPEEIGFAHEWSAARFGDDRKSPSAEPPFSFTYDGRPSPEILKTWKTERSARALDEARTERVLIFSDPDTGLMLTCRAVEYRDFPTVEWTVYLKNAGPKDTPILENIQALDLRVERARKDGEFVLHHNQGSMTTAKDFQPFATPLAPGKELRLGTSGGRPMNVTMPYFNLAWGEQGMIIVVSWVGQWAASFNRDAGGGLRVASGQERTHFRLHPGEEARTPLIALQFYRGSDVVRSQNIWRRWMVDLNLPCPGGKPFPSIISASSRSFYDGAAEEITAIKGCAARGLKFDYWWRDAGWYPCGNHWWSTGTWVPDPARYPKGLREVADAAHAAGMKFTVWFEPERAVPGSWLYLNHPEWMYGPGESARLIDLGNPDAFKWLVDMLDKLIVENGIDMYRQDYNFDPLGHWRHDEPGDRQGITEIRQVVGLLAFWDELKRRHPDMPFDNCASGGMRNVLEMMRRGVPLSKSDLSGGTISSQCQLHGLAPWLPYFGAGCPLSGGRYVQRSNMAPWIGTAEDTDNDALDYADMRRFVAEWRRVIPCYWGDFYPLTPYTLEENVWMAWQFDVPEKGEGLVQAFRREKAEIGSGVFKLRGLDAAGRYAVENLDGGKVDRLAGRALMDDGLRIEIPDRPGASLIVYRKE